MFGSYLGRADARRWPGRQSSTAGASVTPPGGGYAGSNLRTILKRAGSLVISRLGGSLLTFLYVLLAARISTPDQFGLFMTAFSWSMLLSVVLSLNTEAGSIRFLVRAVRDDQPEVLAGFIGFNLRVVTIVTTLMLAAVLVAWSIGLIDSSEQAGRLCLLSFVAAVPLALARVYGRHSTALDSVWLGSFPRVLLRPALICAGVGLMAAFGVSARADTLMSVALIAASVTALVQVLLLSVSIPDRSADAPDMSNWRQWLITGGMMAPMLLVRDYLKNIVIVAAGLTMSAEEVGYLALALSICGLIHYGVKAVDVSVSPLLSADIQAVRGARVSRLCRASAVIKLVWTISGLVALTLLGGRIFPGFGPDYAVALAPTLVLMALPAADAVFGASYIVLNIAGKPEVVFWTSAFGVVLIAVATALGGSLFGPIGAAVGTGASYLILQAAFCLASRRTVGVDPSVFGSFRTTHRHRGDGASQVS